MDEYLGMIKMFAGPFAPRNFAYCNGQLLSIAQNTALFSIIGVSYGGNGSTTFGLPNLQGRVPMGAGNGAGLTGRSLGETAGQESVTLTIGQMPQHNHSFSVPATSVEGTTRDPSGAIPAKEAAGVTAPYSSGTADKVLRAGATEFAGSNQPHPNLQPYQVVNFVICTQGVFPTRN